MRVANVSGASCHDTHRVRSTGLSPARQSGLHIRPNELCRVDTARTTARVDAPAGGAFSRQRHSSAPASSLVRRVQLGRSSCSNRWTPITGERHAVRTQGNGCGHECGGAVWFGGSARPPVCDGGAIVAGSAVAIVMRPERRGRGRRRPESEGLFRWRVGEQCGANWAWMSMRRRLITRELTHRVLSRRSASRPGPLCRLAWRVGFGGLVAGRASRPRGATTAHAGRQAVLPQSFPREERA